MEAWLYRACHEGQKQEGEKMGYGGNAPLRLPTKSWPGHARDITKGFSLLYTAARTHPLDEQRYSLHGACFLARACGGGKQNSPDQRGHHHMRDVRSWLLDLGRTGSMQGASWEAKARRWQREAWE